MPNVKAVQLNSHNNILVSDKYGLRMTKEIIERLRDKYKERLEPIQTKDIQNEIKS